MKRALKYLLLLFLFIPINAWAINPISDASLSDVTGQSGMSINVDVTVNISLGTTAWGDATGLDAPWDSSDSDTGGYMGLRDLTLNNLRIRSRESDSFGDYSMSRWKPITIDVAQSPDVYEGATFVRLGLGALEVTWDYLQLEAANGTSPNNLDQKLGEIYLGSLHLYLNPASYIDIYNGRSGGGVGVTMNWYSIADRIELSSVSWGDSDGLPAGSLGTDGLAWISPGQDAGYVGLSNIALTNTSVIGAFAIDVVTCGTGLYYNMNGGDTTVVHVSFPTDLNLYTQSLTADVTLDRTPSLNSPDAGNLGNIYIRDFSLTVHSTSWIDIWAH